MFHNTSKGAQKRQAEQTVLKIKEELKNIQPTGRSTLFPGINIKNAALPENLQKAEDSLLINRVKKAKEIKARANVIFSVIQALILNMIPKSDLGKKDLPQIMKLTFEDFWKSYIEDVLKQAQDFSHSLNNSIAAGAVDILAKDLRKLEREEEKLFENVIVLTPCAPSLKK